MVRHQSFLFRSHNTVFFLFTRDDYLYGFEQICLCHILSAVLNCIDSSLVDHICKIRSHTACGCKCDCIQINGIIHLDIFGMYTQSLHTAFQIRFVYDNTTVKTSRSQ